MSKFHREERERPRLIEAALSLAEVRLLLLLVPFWVSCSSPCPPPLRCSPSTSPSQQRRWSAT